MHSIPNRYHRFTDNRIAKGAFHTQHRSFAKIAFALGPFVTHFLALAAFGQTVLGNDHLQLSGVIRAHDPSSLLKEGGRYYYFSTGEGILSRSSTDWKTWQAGPPVFQSAPRWWTETVPGWKSGVWAPDVAHFNGQYHLYYSISLFGKQSSAIGLATNPTLDPNDPRYRWTDRGAVVQSRVGSPYNTIDPCIFRDRDGSVWLVFGSYWNGIYIAPIDPKTGKLLKPDAPPKHLAKSGSIEAATLYRRGDNYYLFVNWGTCCQGVKSTYNIRMGRGVSPTGPFYDRSGIDLAEGGGTLFLDKEGKYIGPGHISLFTKDGQDYFGFHYYDGENRGERTYAIRRLYWTDAAWPTPNDPSKK